jgi:von Willebrand factor type A domain
MALRHASWVVAVLTLSVLVFLIRPPEGRTSAPAATDVLFVFDTTGSMSGALSEAKAQAAQVMSSLSGRLPNLRFGIAQVRDYGSTPVWRVEQTITSNQAAVQTAIDGLSADEGGDAPEAYGTALHQSRTDVAAGWAPAAKHLVVLIADDVPHDDDLNEGVPPEIVNQSSPWNTGIDPGPDGDGIDWQQELASFKGADFTLAFVLYHGVPAYLPYWNWWAGLTGGQATESSSSTPLGDVLIEIITASASTCQSDGEDDPPQCDADEAPPFSSDAPVLPAAPAPVDSSDPDAPNDGAVSGTCSPPMPPGPEQGVQAGAEAAAASAPATSPWFCPAAGEVRPSVPAVTWSQNTSAITFRNADGIWTIYKRCIDRTASGQRTTVGPGYIAELTRSGTSIVQDFRARGDTVTPGYINAVNGGLGTFGWHHARGPVGNTPAGDDPTTAAVEVGVGRSPQVIEGRMCAATNNGYGVYARNWMGPTRSSPTRVDYTMDVWFRDKYGSTGAPVNSDALVRVRYRYTFYRSSASLWALVTTYAAPNAAGTAFVKEPKFTALTRDGRFRRMVVFDGPDGRAYRLAVVKGEPEGTSVLTTEHSAADGRKRVRWDYDSTTDGDGSPGCTSAMPCLNVVARSFPTAAGSVGIVRTDDAANWEGAGLGLDAWAVASAARAKAYPRDTRGDDSVSGCKVPPPPHKKLSEVELSRLSEAASPGMDEVREWELGGWKSGANKGLGPYQAALALFPGWEDGRGGWDCEPLQRTFGPTGESWGSYFSYSLNDGWKLTG